MIDAAVLGKDEDVIAATVLDEQHARLLMTLLRSDDVRVRHALVTSRQCLVVKWTLR